MSHAAGRLSLASVAARQLCPLDLAAPRRARAGATMRVGTSKEIARPTHCPRDLMRIRNSACLCERFGGLDGGWLDCGGLVESGEAEFGPFDLLFFLFLEADWE